MAHFWKSLEASVSLLALLRISGRFSGNSLRVIRTSNLCLELGRRMTEFLGRPLDAPRQVCYFWGRWRVRLPRLQGLLSVYMFQDKLRGYLTLLQLTVDVYRAKGGYWSLSGGSLALSLEHIMCWGIRVDFVILILFASMPFKTVHNLQWSNSRSHHIDYITACLSLFSCSSRSVATSSLEWAKDGHLFAKPFPPGIFPEVAGFVFQSGSLFDVSSTYKALNPQPARSAQEQLHIL